MQFAFAAASLLLVVNSIFLEKPPSVFFARLIDFIVCEDIDTILVFFWFLEAIIKAIVVPSLPAPIIAIFIFLFIVMGYYFFYVCRSFFFSFLLIVLIILL
jgi:hypothetical protein